MAPTAAEATQATVAASPRSAKYAAVVDRESAREILAAKLEAGAAAEAEERSQRAERSTKERAPSTRRTTREDDSIVEDVVKSGAFRQFMRTAAAEIARGMFGTGRRR